MRVASWYLFCGYAKFKLRRRKFIRTIPSPYRGQRVISEKRRSVEHSPRSKYSRDRGSFVRESRSCSIPRQSWVFSFLFYTRIYFLPCSSLFQHMHIVDYRCTNTDIRVYMYTRWQSNEISVRPLARALYLLTYHACLFLASKTRKRRAEEDKWIREKRCIIKKFRSVKAVNEIEPPSLRKVWTAWSTRQTNINPAEIATNPIDACEILLGMCILKWCWCIVKFIDKEHPVKKIAHETREEFLLFR